MRGDDILAKASIINKCCKGNDINIKLVLRKGDVPIYGTFTGVSLDSIGVPVRFRVKIKRSESNIDLEFKSNEISKFYVL